jgi:UDP-GlcNAc:undecaprenyl-phosphate GlcNAc-1-phosphate transferase
MALDSFFFIFFSSVLLNFFLIKHCTFFFKNITDTEFTKPQAFHKFPAIRSGGITILIFLLFFLFFYESKNNFLSSIVVLSVFFFFIGFLEDIKIKTKPQIRLFFLFIISFFTLYNYDISILNTQIEFLNKIIYLNKFTSILFVCLCLLIITNGCNFIDGFNGLLILHTIIILIILYYVNHFNSNNFYLENIILFFILIYISLLFFNFPKAKIFLGDSGAYISGIILSITIIQVSNLNEKISPFFFASLLFYIFFEVIFSFFRKIFINRKSPLKPDNKHLHMLFFRFINRNKIKDQLKANFLTSLTINLFYLILILPNLLFYKRHASCKTYFFLLIIFYMFSYILLEKKVFKKK